MRWLHPKEMTKVLYVTSEESARQTALRAGQLGVKSDQLLVLAETNVERILHQIGKHQPAVAMVDSIQMVYKPQLPAAPGSITQFRDSCMDLVYLAKASGTAIVLVGHVTKEGPSPGRNSSSISSIPSPISKATDFTPIASCAA